MDKIYGIDDICKLSELKVGQEGKLLSFSNNNPALRRRLLDMGLTKDVLILIQRFSPLGDPVSIKLRGYSLCLRKEDMENIIVKVTNSHISLSKKKADRKNQRKKG